MRLLLLLSALLTALSGVASPRAMAQPVQASAAAAAGIAATRAVTPAVRRFVVPGYGIPPRTTAPLPRLMAAVAGRLLYAERRRE